MLRIVGQQCCVRLLCMGFKTKLRVCFYNKLPEPYWSDLASPHNSETKTLCKLLKKTVKRFLCCENRFFKKWSYQTHFWNGKIEKDFMNARLVNLNIWLDYNTK